MGQTHSNIVKGHTERAMVEQDTMVLAKDTEKELTKVSFNLAETSEESLSEEEEIDDDFDEDLEEGLAERRRILDEAKELKKLARMYLHPEDKVVSNPSAFGRCYFDRASAPEQETYEESETRAEILADAAKMKRLAAHYMHPEVGVHTADATACGRNYFDRASAPEQETYEESETRAEILADAAKMKRLAAHYMHPEVGVHTADATACGRNYFDRASAPEQETYEEAEERAKVFSDCVSLLKSIESAAYKPMFENPSSTVHVRNMVAPFVKTVDTTITMNVSRSASHVKLFGLDEEFGDATY